MIQQKFIGKILFTQPSVRKIRSIATGNFIVWIVYYLFYSILGFWLEMKEINYTKHGVVCFYHFKPFWLIRNWFIFHNLMWYSFTILRQVVIIIDLSKCIHIIIIRNEGSIKRTHTYSGYWFNGAFYQLICNVKKNWSHDLWLFCCL